MCVWPRATSNHPFKETIFFLKKWQKWNDTEICSIRALKQVNKLNTTDEEVEERKRSIVNSAAGKSCLAVDWFMRVKCLVTKHFDTLNDCTITQSAVCQLRPEPTSSIRHKMSRAAKSSFWLCWRLPKSLVFYFNVTTNEREEKITGVIQSNCRCHHSQHQWWHRYVFIWP